MGYGGQLKPPVTYYGGKTAIARQLVGLLPEHEALSARADGWLSYATCPVCHVMVVADGHNPAHGDHTWAHERWHARNDFPVPAGLLTEADIKAGYAPE